MRLALASARVRWLASLGVSASLVLLLLTLGLVVETAWEIGHSLRAPSEQAVRTVPVAHRRWVVRAHHMSSLMGRLEPAR